ncbi:hypothetical protein BMI91_05695 [Thioclava sediminum]|uniref:Glycosyltransferase n=1 Tax=Thioclava sediminum TaxID=1915319 RepID=A0ABX3N4P8_9RHOB|nr:glycosyltransferase [Thioclava sediminum]OOY25880.1 hypothetical protein BMI91_05695 [Thioclava sediminum]
MKIVQSTALADTRGGGVAEVVFNLTSALAERGHAVSVLGRVSPDQTEASAARVPALLPAETGHEAADILVCSAPEVVHSHGLWDPYLSAILGAAGKRRVPTVIAPHGMLDAWALAHGRLKKRLALATFEGRNLRRAACIHALTEAERAAVKSLFPHMPVAVIPNGVSLPTTLPPDEVEGGDKMLLFLGRIHPKKGIVELVEAFAALARMPAAAGWRLEIAGWDDGGHAAEVEAIISSHGLGDRARLVGPVFGADKDALIAGAAAFALTSYSEGLPMAVLEAWAQARPVLITPACNLPEAEAAGAAVVCAPGSEGAREGLARLLALGATERAAMGRAGHALVAARYDWDQVAERLETLYEWIGGTGGRPDFVS